MTDCTFSPIDVSAGLPPGQAGALWHFARPDDRMEFHRHPELEANLVTRGRAEYLLENRRYSLRAGCVVWLFPHQYHILLGRSPDFAMWILLATPTLVARSTNDRTLSAPNPAGEFCRTVDHPTAHRLAELLGEIAEARSDSHQHNAGVAYALLRLWAEWGRADSQPAAPPTPVDTMLEALHAALWQERAAPSLKEFARTCGLSPPRLSALFAEQQGIPLARYRNEQRLARFLSQIAADPTVSTTDAALAAGFGSYAQFYRVFCRQMGCSPQAYRGRQEER